MITEHEQIIKALAVTFERLQQEIPANALVLLADDLLPFGIERVARGLDLCIREWSGKLIPAVITEKIQQADGRLGVGEAWALAIRAADERNTVVWTDEIAQAWSTASALYDGDKFGARKAFEEAYQRALRAAIGTCKPVIWMPSIGWDASARDTALTDAVTKGLLTHDAVAGFLPPPEPSAEDGESEGAGGVVAVVVGLLAGPVSDKASKKAPLTNEEQRQRLAEAKAAIFAGQSKRADAALRKRNEFEAEKREMLERAKDHPLMTASVG